MILRFKQSLLLIFLNDCRGNPLGLGIAVNGLLNYLIANIADSPIIILNFPLLKYIGDLILPPRSIVHDDL